MYQSLWLCADPERLIGSCRVLLVMACTASATVVPWTHACTAQFDVKPVAIVWFDERRGSVALAPDLTIERVEELLLEETRWAKDA